MPEDDEAWVYTLAPKKFVLTREFVRELAKKMEALNLSRQKSIDWLDERLFHDLDRPVHHFNGQPFIVHRDIIDEAYGWTDEYRWNSDIKRFASEYPKRVPNKRNLLRFQLWDLAFKINGDPIIF